MTTPEPQPPVAPSQPNPYWPPQQAYAQPVPPQAPRPVSKRLQFWTSAPGVLSMLAIMGGLIVLIVGVSSRLAGPPADNFETRVTGCTATTGSLATATVDFTVTNTSKIVRTARLDIEYRDADGSRLDTDTSYVRNIAPGDTARSSESTILDGAASRNITCRITGIH